MFLGPDTIMKYMSHPEAIDWNSLGLPPPPAKYLPPLVTDIPGMKQIMGVYLGKVPSILVPQKPPAAFDAGAYRRDARLNNSIARGLQKFWSAATFVDPSEAVVRRAVRSPVPASAHEIDMSVNEQQRAHDFWSDPKAVERSRDYYRGRLDDLLGRWPEYKAKWARVQQEIQEINARNAAGVPKAPH